MGIKNYCKFKFSTPAGSDADLLYNVDLKLDAKMKISDKPIKHLLATRSV